MNDRSWRIDFGRVAIMMLPTFLRKPVMGKYVRLMMSGVSYVHSSLVTYRAATRYELGLTGQVCRLRGMLNDVFDAKERRIKIEDVATKPTGTVVYWRSERQGMLVGMRMNGGVTISCRGYEGVKQPDFEVVVPAGMEVDERKVSALVSGHKLAGKRYILTKLK